MVITVDLPEALVELIDTRISARPRRPAWPFRTHSVVRQTLNSEARKLLGRYLEQYTLGKKYEAPKLHLRSALARVAFSEFWQRPRPKNLTETQAQ